MNKTDLSSILSEKPYLPKDEDSFDRPAFLSEEIGSPKKVSGLRKRHLEDAEVSTSPFKKRRTTSYGTDPLSKKAIAFKKENNITTGRNVAIVVYTSPRKGQRRYTIAATSGLPGQTHAELLALDLVPKHVTKIDQIYTEREPCKKGSNCHRKLKATIQADTEVVYSTEYPADQEERQKTEKAFRELQKKHGIREPKK